MNDANRALGELAERQYGVVSRAQAAAVGLTRHDIAGRVARGQLEQVSGGALRLPGSQRTFHQDVMAGVLVAGKGARASHRAAGALLDFPDVPRWVEVTVPVPRAVRVPGLVVHRSRVLPPQECGEVLGIPSTTCGRTLLDLAGEPSYDRDKVGKLLDYAWVNALVTRPGLEALLERHARGRRAASVLAELVRELPSGTRPRGSEFEGDLFGVLRYHGLPLPLSQYRVRLPGGAEVFLDFAFPEHMLALEADSFLFHATREAWRRDRRRNNELIALGWSILAITWDQVQFHPGELARMVAAALASRPAA